MVKRVPVGGTHSLSRVYRWSVDVPRQHQWHRFEVVI